MADSSKQPRGVRGPGGPPPPGPRGSIERASLPLLLTLRRVPRWVLVVVSALLLFGGLVMPPGLGWLGGLLLALVGAFLGWLLLLSWPVLGPSSRLLRLIVIVAVLGIAWFKALGRL